MPVGADRKRAGFRRCAARRLGRGAVRARARARRRRRRSFSTPERSRPTRDSTCCLRRARHVRGVAAGRAVRARGRASRSRSRSRARQAAAAGVGFGGRSSPVSVRPRKFPAFLDAADVLVSPRSTGHQHAAEDLSVPPVGPADRRNPPADAHAGARRRRGDPDGRDAAGVRRGILAALADPARARAVGAGARSSPSTKYSYEAYLARTRQACAHSASASRAPQVAGGRRVTGATSAAVRSLQLLASTPIPAWRRRSTGCASAARSDG